MEVQTGEKRRSKKKDEYRPVYHFVDEGLFTAFIERLPRSALTDPLRNDQVLRNRLFPGFRITETTPNPQQVLAAYRKEVTAQAPPLPLQERQGGLAGPVPPHGVGEKFQCIAALDHTGPGHGEQAGGGYLAVGALVSE